jgi:CRISPR-associated protein Cas5d
MKDWCLEVWGGYACFTRPEMKVERVSYDVMTPSAARAIFDAILWKPAIRWHITKIEVLNPIKWVSVRRNEVGAIASERSEGIFIEDVRQQRAGLFLKNVRYRIHAYFEFIPPEKRRNCANTPPFWADADEAKLYGEPEKHTEKRTDETEAKYAAMFERRVKKGQCFHRPYLGCREFACYFCLIENDDGVKPVWQTAEKPVDLGWMLYDINFDNPSNPKPEFFRAELKNGVLVTDRRKVEVRS